MEQYHMVTAGERVLLGLSGGADSVCLFHLLRELQEPLGFSLLAVHVNHNLRGAEAGRDAAFAENLCREYDVPFYLYSCPVEKIAKEKHLSTEEAGRAARQEVFAACAKEQRAVKIALAHHQDDDADWDKLHTRQQQTDAQFNEASAMKPLLLPQVRESIEHNSHVSSQLTDHASKKIKTEQSDQSASTDSNTADAQESGKSSHKNDENLSDEQRRKIEELLAQNAQSTQSDPNDDSGSAAKKNPSTSSSQTKPW